MIFLDRGQLILIFSEQGVGALPCALTMAHGKGSIDAGLNAEFAVCHDQGTRHSLPGLPCALVMAHGTPSHVCRVPCRLAHGKQAVPVVTSFFLPCG